MTSGTFVVAIDPDAPADQRYRISVPVAGHDRSLRLASPEPWPGNQRLRCYRDDADGGAARSFDGLEVVDEVAVVSSERRGPSLDVVLDRKARSRCRFVVAPVELDERGSAATDEQGVFWQTGASAAQAAPRQRVPTARERGVVELDVVVDTREQGHTAWTFEGLPVTTSREKLDAGDYAVVDSDGAVIAAVERKKASDFASCLTTGRMPDQMAALSCLPRAAVVVEASYARILNRKRVTRDRMADLVAAVQASFPAVPIVFAGTRDTAQEWAYHWLATCVSHHDDETAPSPLDP